MDSSSKPTVGHAALMAHQMKSPLAAANSLISSVLGEYVGELSDQQKKLLKMADERLAEANETVQRVMEISRPARGRSEKQALLADAVLILQQAELSYLQQAAAMNQTLRLQIDLEQALVAILKSSFIEMMNALVNNAVKYTPDGGELEIVLRPGAGNTVMVQVGDSGPGIPEDQHEAIFEPFYRSETAAGSSRSGVGLGLAFVRDTVAKAGGTIEVGESALGGALFTLILPALGDEALELTEAAVRPLRVVVVGGVTAGPKAAAKVMRLVDNADVTVVERGVSLSYAGCGLPYYISGAVEEPRELMSSPAGMVRDSVFFRSMKNVHVRNRTEVVEFDRTRSEVLLRDCVNGKEEWIEYDRLLLATGALSRVLPIPGAKTAGVFHLHGMRDAEGIKQVLDEERARDVVIIGGGLIGVEVTEAIASRGCRVTMLEREPQILGMLDLEMAKLVERQLERNGVKVLCGATVESIEAGEDGWVQSVRTDRGEVHADLVIMAVGVEPNTQLAQLAGLEICEATGAIAVDTRMRTSDPKIFAAGDCCRTTHLLTGRPTYRPMGSTASKQGRVAAVNICGGHDSFAGVLGTTICKVFDHAVGCTGLTETEAIKAGYDVIPVMAPGPDREAFMPDSRLIYLKIVVDRCTHRIIGAQAAGPGEVSKRIDIAAMAISAGMRVEELSQADLCYAPAYAAVMDSMINAANIARNKLEESFEGVSSLDLQAALEAGEGLVLVDVRTAGEFRRRRIPGAVSIPLASLRSRLRELPLNQRIVIYGEISLRAYEAALTLRAVGYEEVQVLDGGIAMWPFRVER
ncbi:MAG: FAD-dependent oxidoreductase [Planctomycetota bacterium]|jgi:NADPH-dependent 2,4-dienoyl-CoA reductase/sulfur reductase-like enzyme/rhodanese-related sulfurtransferase